MKRPKKIGFAASVVMYVQRKKGRQTHFPVHENVFLVSARSYDEARRRAEEWRRALKTLIEGGPTALVYEQ